MDFTTRLDCHERWRVTSALERHPARPGTEGTDRSVAATPSAMWGPSHPEAQSR
jgi:hypothetical protein